MPKSVLITGGTGGIGRACVEKFVSTGWSVVFTYLNSEETAGLICRESGGAARALRLDLSKPEDIEELIGGESFDAVVNNAGESRFSLLWDDTVSQTRSFLDRDLVSPHEILRTALKKMLPKGGAAVNVASMWGQSGASCESLYSAAKGGLIALTRALALELGPSGIRVNCVSPGAVETGMNARLSEDEKRELILRIPMGRFGTPGEIASLIAFLCSEDASYITGQNICPNGGQII